MGRILDLEPLPSYDTNSMSSEAPEAGKSGLTQRKQGILAQIGWGQGRYAKHMKAAWIRIAAHIVAFAAVGLLALTDVDPQDTALDGIRNIYLVSLTITAVTSLISLALTSQASLDLEQVRDRRRIVAAAWLVAVPGIPLTLFTVYMAVTTFLFSMFTAPTGALLSLSLISASVFTVNALLGLRNPKASR